MPDLAEIFASDSDESDFSGFSDIDSDSDEEIDNHVDPHDVEWTSRLQPPRVNMRDQFIYCVDPDQWLSLR